MFRFTSRVLALLLALWACNSMAIDLVQAYRAAREYDATTLAAVASAQAGREVVPQALAQLRPNVSASVVRNRNQLRSETQNFFGNVATTDTAYPSSSDTVSVRQPLYRKFQWATLQQAYAQEREADAALNNEFQNLAVRVASAYFEALLAVDQAELMRSQVGSRTLTLDAARKMFASGSATRTDIDEAQSRLDLAVAQELEARQSIDTTRRQLEIIVGQPVDSLSQLRAEDLKLESPQPEILEAWIEKAIENNAEIQIMRARLDVAQREVERARSGHHPTLDAVAQWSRTSSENNNSINSRYENRSLGLQLNVPLYAGGAVNSAIRQALANEERVRQSLEAVRRDVSVRVHKEFRGVTEGLLRIKALTQAVRSADQTVLSTQKSLQAGFRTRLDVSNAQDARLSAMRDLAQARYVYLISNLRLAALVNEADYRAIQQLNVAFEEK